MSLLLDALKKAADDKKKTSLDVDKAAESNQSLELELHSNNDFSDIQAEDAPEVDDSALYANEQAEVNSLSESIVDNSLTKHVETNNVTQTETKEPAITQTNNTENTIRSTATTDTVISELNEPASDKIEVQESHTSQQQPDSIVSEEKITETLSHPAETERLTLQSSSAPKKTDIQDNSQIIKNEHALSALINKSHSHSKSQKKRQTISVIFLVSLILIGSGLYFILQMKTANESIYTPQDNSTVIKRSNIKQEIANITDNNQQKIKPVKKTPVPVTDTSSNNYQPLKNSTETKAITNTTDNINHNTTKPTLKQKRALENKPVINIRKNKKPDPIHQLLQLAYNEFNKSNFNQSHSLYNKVLSREPRNRDALLGVSAIAIKQQRFEYARQKYQFLLKLNPRDSIAMAGLSSIQNIINPHLNETQLKFMLQQQPDAAHLHFALGSIYSTQNKWPHAQSAFFSAWSSETRNADYAYNLAVSLDHLNKTEQALNFYRLSLNLADQSNSNFSIENTQKRILALQESAP